MKTIRLGRLDMKAAIKDKQTYEKQLEKLQFRMLSIQQAFYRDRRRGILVAEGWDAAGKGGMIRRLTEALDPRGVRVWPIGPPEPGEQGRHYLYRFWGKLPEPGTIAIFDRSWYGRVLVERVEGLIDRDAWRRAYDEINAFERMLVDDGVRLAKVFLHITPEEQLARFKERIGNPFKRWKLTPADLHSHMLHDQYVAAADQMFDRTSTRAAPWTAIAANHKWHARIRAMETVTEAFARGIDLTPPPLGNEFKRAARRVLGDLESLSGGKPGKQGKQKGKK